MPDAPHPMPQLTPPDVRPLLADLLAGKTLDEATTEQLFEWILAGQVNDAQLGAMLGLIAVRGATVDEIVAGVRVMRRHVTQVPIGDACGPGCTIIDTCGTGGAPKAFNVSTVAAIVAAAASPAGGPQRLLVAKHGGRSRTGRGSAEVLEKLGVNVNASPEVQARCLQVIGVCFSFAQQHHPAMKHAAGARKSLGFPTIFNLVGPLSNPAGAKRQLVGTYSVDAAKSLAGALARLGAERAMVVTSADGLDELTTTAPNHVFVISPDASGVASVRNSVLDARDLGMPRRTLAELQVGSLDDAASIFTRVLDGEAGAAREIVELNAGAALVVGGVATGLREGIAMSREAIESGGAKRLLEQLVRMSNSL